MAARSRAAVTWGLVGLGSASLALSYACDSGPAAHNVVLVPEEGGAPDASVDSAQGADASRDTAPGHDAAADAPRDGGVDGSVDSAANDVLAEDTGLPEAGPPLCDPSAVWGPPTTVLTTGAADVTLFGTVTPDELTVAWASSTAGVVTAWYADRVSTSHAFGAPQPLATTFGAVALDRVTVSSDGLRLVALRSDAAGFVAVTRAFRTGSFDTSDAADFSSFMSGEGVQNTYATPVMSGPGYFDYITTSSLDDHVDCEWGSGFPFSPAGALGNTELERVGTQYRRPTGLSFDERSLFYWDETTGTEKMAVRPDPGQAFNRFVDLGSLTDAVPTASCQRLYYAMPAIDGGPSGAITIVYADSTDQ